MECGVVRVPTELLRSSCKPIYFSFRSLLIFVPLKMMNLLRIDKQAEFRGQDNTKHGEAAYPAEAWVEMQYHPVKKKAYSFPITK